ncbi:hypothetical protein ACSVIJ_13170 [Pseudomonas sp. NCHU5208]|uniref:hypothetical protein n=1 Tax=unclassified Pseudomonas TaxID=196821 RepID=UPI003F9756CD
MIQDKAIAEKVSQLVLDASGKLNESINLVATNCSEEEVAEYVMVVGQLMGSIGIDILNKIYRAHPSIKPEDYYLP